MQTTELVSTLAVDTIKGLSTNPKHLSSKYFYDEEGSKIFQRIMRMPEYYLTDCEYEIFDKQAYSIVKEIVANNSQLELIEFGAGDGLKTKLLIKELYRQNIKFRYIPIDISEEILIGMSTNIRNEFDGLEVFPKAGDYFGMMEELELISDTPKVILFLGSNIGNFSYADSIVFFRKIHNTIRDKDKLIIGFDLKKSPGVILNAYNDTQGYTRDFNLNLLSRLNNELGADFIIENYEHAPLYDPYRGVAKSYIVSKKDQSVFFSKLNKTFNFKKWEAIYTERSQKYDVDMIKDLAEKSGFDVVKNFVDCKEYFADSIWKPIN